MALDSQEAAEYALRYVHTEKMMKEWANMVDILPGLGPAQKEDEETSGRLMQAARA